MDLTQTISLSIVQGITELLPISSTGHLIIVGKALGIENLSNFALTSLHLGTTLAIILFNYKFLFQNLFSKEKLNFYFFIILASIPGALAGVFLNDLVESKFHSTIVIACSLIVVGLLMILFENSKTTQIKTDSLEKITPIQAVIAGIGQTLALIPGTSRSGITTLTGMFSGMDKYTALRFSFILGLPLLLGSFIYEAIKTENSIEILTQPNTMIGVVVTFIVGYFALWLLEKLSRTKFLTYFGIYRIILGVILLVIAL